MPNLILHFNQDVHTKEAVKEYIIQVLRDEAVSRAFNGGETKHLADAKLVLEQAFEKMDLDYPTKVEQIINDSN